jgi:hypothetical protein
LKSHGNTVLATNADGVAGAAGFGIGKINVEQTADRRTEFLGVSDDLPGIPDEVGGFGGRAALGCISA